MTNHVERLNPRGHGRDGYRRSSLFSREGIPASGGCEKGFSHQPSVRQPSVRQPSVHQPSVHQHRVLLASIIVIGLVTLDVSAVEPVFRAVEIDNAIDVGYAVTVGEMNGDGRPDILVVDSTEIVWYENPSWTKHVILSDAVQRDHVCIAAADVDSDGLSDIVIGAHWAPRDTVNSGSVHYLVPAADRRKPFTPVTLPREPTVHRMRWGDIDGDHRLELVMAPLHGRGNKNFQGDGVRVLAYEVPKDKARGTWTTEVIDDGLHVVHNLELVQWDDDPADEVLLASFEGVFLCDRNAAGKWTRTQVASGNQKTKPHRGSSEIRVGRLPDKRRYLATVEPWHGNQVVVYTPPVKAGALWRRHVVSEQVKEGHAVACADLFGSGHDQLLIGWRQPAGPDNTVGINLYQPADGSGDRWTTHAIDVGGMACEDLTVADLNGDGKPDIVAAGRATKNVKIYFNESASASARVK